MLISHKWWGRLKELHAMLKTLWDRHLFMLLRESFPKGYNSSGGCIMYYVLSSLSGKSHVATEGSPSHPGQNKRASAFCVRFITTEQGWEIEIQDIFCSTSLVFHKLWKCGTELGTVNNCRRRCTWQVKAVSDQWLGQGLLLGLSQQFSYIWEADFQTAVFLFWSTEL